MKKILIIAALLLLITPLVASAFQFDPGGAIGGSLGLPKEDVPSLAIRIIQYALATVGLVATLMILYGGFRYLTSAGNQEAIDSAKKIIRAAVIGLIMIILSQALFMFIVNIIDRVTS